MNSTAALAFLVLALLLCQVSVEGQRCPNCPNGGEPVCATRLRGRRISCTFSNFCKLKRRECTHREAWGALLGRCQMESPECRSIGGR